jgi:cytochrome c oxidase cbb3-type subunit III
MHFYRIYFRFTFFCVACLLSRSLVAATPIRQSPGKRLFTIHCAVCHGPTGEGGKGPTLAVPRLVRASTYKSLVEIIRDGIPGTEMPESGLGEAQIRQLAAYVRQLSWQPVGPVIGDRRAGEQLNWGRGSCSTCHVLRGQGTPIGPELTEIGSRRGASYLRESLIDPEADIPKSTSLYRAEVSIPTNFLQVEVRVQDGRNIFGVRVNEDTSRFRSGICPDIFTPF